MSEFCIAAKSKAIVNLPPRLPAAFPTADLAQPGGPRKRQPSTSRSCIHVSMVPVSSVFTPLKSVPLPANAFSISSMKTITRGGSMPFSTALRNCLMLSAPPICSKESLPRQIVNPGVCSMSFRFRPHSPAVSSPFCVRDIANACSAGKAASPTKASVAFVINSGVGGVRSAAVKVSRTTRSKSATEGKGSSRIKTSDANSGGSTAPGVVTRTSIWPLALKESRKFQMPCATTASS